jgi:hypothetical protein
MLRTAAAPFLLVSLVSVATTTAQETLSVDEILARHAAARGGYERIKALETVVYSNGLYQEGDYKGSGNAMMSVSRPYHRVVGNPEDRGALMGGYMEGYDGAAWEWFSEPGIVVRTVGAAAGAMRRGADVEGPLIDYREKGSAIELGEPADIGGRPAYRLIVTLRDGFQRQYFVDQETFLVTAERRAAPFHAFGDAITSETRIGDYRPIGGVLFAHSFVQTEIATGEEMSRMQWGKIEVDRELPMWWFSPPRFERTEYQSFLERLFGERADKQAVMWSYRDYRRAYPNFDTRAGIELIGYQILKMGDVEAAVALLEANAEDHPGSSTSAFGLGRAYDTAGDQARARTEFERALRLDPENKRARAALAALDDQD